MIRPASILLSLCLALLLGSCASVLTAVNEEGIEEDPTRRSLGTVMDDNSLGTVIKVNLNAADEQLKNSNISVEAHNGVVLLVGQVPSQDLKNLATRVATNSSTRVKTVYNELEVAGKTGFLSRSNDAWLTTKVKGILLANQHVSGLGTRVITENGVVYLMGIVTREEADQIVDIVSSTSGVTKVVRAFEYVN